MRRPSFCGWAVLLSAPLAFGACAVEQTPPPRPPKAVKPPPPARPVSQPEPEPRPAAAPRPPAFNCENICARNIRCADAIAEVMVEGLPVAVQKRAAESIKKSFAGHKCVRECQKSMKRTDPTTRRMAKKLQLCFSTLGCRDYATCIKEMAK